MKSLCRQNLRFALIGMAMLTAVLTIGFLVESSIPRFKSQTPSFHFSPAAGVLSHPDADAVGCRARERQTPSAAPDNEIRASIMWGSFIPQKPSPNLDAMPGTIDPRL